MYNGVPTAASGVVTVFITSAVAIPKSVNFTSPVSVINTFAGLTSLCVIPLSWVTAKAEAI